MVKSEHSVKQRWTMVQSTVCRTLGLRNFTKGNERLLKVITREQSAK